MKKLINFFSKKHTGKLNDCTQMQLNKDEADAIHGGFKEYKPPIYEPEEANEHTFRTVDLLTDIHQTK
jgi:hypothetical protein